MAIAPTGAGKTTLFTKLLPYRAANLMFGTKIDDPLYRQMIGKMGYTRVERMSDIRPWHNNKILLWPSNGKTIKETMLKQHDAFNDALNTIATNKQPWTLWVDETKYAVQQLGLGAQLTYSVEQLRSVNGTIVMGAQRPAYVRGLIANVSHAFLWKSTHREDAAVLADMGGIDSKAVRDEALTLGSHEMLYMHTRGTDSKVYRTEVTER